MKRSAIPVTVLILQTLAGCGDSSSTFHLDWDGVVDRPWAGPDLWANRTQDWEVRNGRLTALSTLPMRTVHILTVRGAPDRGGFKVTLKMGLTQDRPDRSGSDPEGPVSGAGGLLLGAGGPDLDFRKAALIHHSPGPGGGLFLGVDREGRLLISDFSDENRILARSDAALASTASFVLDIEVGGEEGGARADGARDGPTLSLEAHTALGGDPPVTLELGEIGAHRAAGGMAMVSDGGDGSGVRAWFESVEILGPGFETFPDRRLGPILGGQHLLTRDVLTLSAQLFPISPFFEGPGTASEDTIRMEIQDEAGDWAEAARAPVVVPGYTATFRVESWPEDRPVPYRLTLLEGEDQGSGDPFLGTVHPEPEIKEEMVVAVFTGNHNVASPGVDQGSFEWKTNLWFPHTDIVTHVQAHAPDFLFFSGDQVYEGASPTQADFQHPYQDYLYKWYLWLWAFRDLTAEIPSVAIPDDHDVFQGNVWGAGGRATPPGLTGAAAQDQGGYRLPPDWVNMVQRTQAAHLPPPRGPNPLEGGIEVYYTDIEYGGVSFAVLEDRKFKSPPKLLVPEADVWNGWAQNPAFDPKREADPPGASLLGPDQEAFLEEWASDWTHGIWMKVVLSQTLFGNVATIPSDAMNGSVIPSLPIPEPGAYVTGDKKAADMDSNGWPPSGRDRALRSMRKGFAVHLAGDQHLASTVQYGIDGFGDGPFALCVPSVANFWPRRWYPPEPGSNRSPGAPAYTGDFLDGFGNPITVFAVSNPARWGRDPAALHDRAPGYGIARFNRTTREVSLEAWPRWSDPAAGDSPYPGWPVRFQQGEGYGREPWGYLPTLVVEGLDDPVVQVISEAGGDIVYTIRIQGTRFSPRVFEPGSYSVRVGEPGTEAMRAFLGLEALPEPGRTLEVGFGSSPD